jgi:hypothetical protein
MKSWSAKQTDISGCMLTSNSDPCQGGFKKGNFKQMQQARGNI